jgi:hypothetical protein
MASLNLKLSPDEVAVATDPARQREGRSPRAAIAELALATAIGRPWDGEFTDLKSWDTWPRLRIKVARLCMRAAMPPSGDMRVRQDDPDDTVFVLVDDYDRPIFRFEGWLLGSDAKRVGSLIVSDQKYGPHFRVPRQALKSCLDLKKKRERKPDVWPSMRKGDDGRHPSKVTHSLIRSKFTYPCFRCGNTIPVGALVGGSVATSTIHGDPAECGYVPKDTKSP